MKAKKTKAAKPMAKSVYKKGGSTKTKRQKSLDRWTKQKWRTASGKKSSETGEGMHLLEQYLSLRVQQQVEKN